MGVGVVAEVRVGVGARKREMVGAKLTACGWQRNGESQGGGEGEGGGGVRAYLIEGSYDLRELVLIEGLEGVTCRGRQVGT